MQVAVSTSGGAFTPEAGATDASASQPAVGISSAGQVFVASVSGGTVQARIRSAGGTWGSETSLGSGAAPSVSADSSGDVVVSWPGSIRVYDASPPSVTVVPPSSPQAPGTHSWSVTTSDVWSDPGTTSWSFDDNGSVVSGGTGSPVSHLDNNPGPETATATQTDAAGNVATDSATITISAVGPQNTALPTITNGSAPADGDTLDYSAGSWTGNPTPTVSHVWQRCNRDLSVDRSERVRAIS